MLKNVLPILHSRIAAVAPIHGCSQTGITFKEEATVQQRAAAQAILDAFDPKAAQAEIEAEEAEEKARAEWLKTAKSEVEALKVQKAEKAAMDATAQTLEERIAALEVWTKIPKVPK